MRKIAILTAAAFLFDALSAAAQTGSAPLTRIGGAAAVKGLVNAIAPDAKVGRVIESGKPLYLNDHVTTKGDSRLQVMLLDETVFTVGPDSDMVLDEFVYDPSTNAGKVTARLTKGVFRFVTGKVARQAPTNMKITVPTATIGIRGTKAVLEVKNDRTTVILEGAGKNNTANEMPGRLEVWTNDGPSQLLTREGFGSDLIGGRPAMRPSDFSKELERLNNLLSPHPRTAALPYGGDIKRGRADAVNETGGVIRSLGSLAGTVTMGQQSNQNSQITNQASQNTANVGGVADGLTTWDFIAQQLTSGQGVYSGAGSYTCTSGCGGSGTINFMLNVDFGARTLGGGGSNINLSSPVGDGGDSTNINTVSFGSSGPATLTLSGAAITNTNFSGTTVSLLNLNGAVAKQAQINLSYSNTFPQAASGSAVGSR